MNVKAIVAVDPTGIIGVNGRIPWHYKADFALFKRLTLGGVCVMGRKTFESIPPNKKGEVLPGREIIVLTHDQQYAPWLTASNAVEANGFGTALDIAKYKRPKNPQVWICGGAQVYSEASEFFNVLDEIHVTVVPAVDPSDDDEVTYWDPFAVPGFVEICRYHPEGFAEAALVYRVLSRQS